LKSKLARMKRLEASQVLIRKFWRIYWITHVVVHGESALEERVLS